MVKKKSSKTMNCVCNSVQNDSFGLSGKAFVNFKNGAGKCRCAINNNDTGKTSKPVSVQSVVLSERVDKK